MKLKYYIKFGKMRGLAIKIIYQINKNKLNNNASVQTYSSFLLIIEKWSISSILFPPCILNKFCF